MSLLAIDVGNSNVTIGLFEGDELQAHWRLQTIWERTADEYGLLISQFIQRHRDFNPRTANIEAIVTASVVPPLRPTFAEMCRRFFGIDPLEVGPETDTGMPIHYSPAADVGADRIVNAVAAIHRYGAPCIVVDFGTATTFDAISAEGCYIGGAIAPGIGISMEALFRRAARLPRVELRRPPTSIGRSTVESMQSGFLYGFVGQVQEICRRFREELGKATPTIATGGLADLIARETGCIDTVDDWLTLHGLRLVKERLSPSPLSHELSAIG